MALKGKHENNSYFGIYLMWFLRWKFEYVIYLPFQSNVSTEELFTKTNFVSTSWKLYTEMQIYKTSMLRKKLFSLQRMPRMWKGLKQVCLGVFFACSGFGFSVPWTQNIFKSIKWNI